MTSKVLVGKVTAPLFSLVGLRSKPTVNQDTAPQDHGQTVVFADITLDQQTKFLGHNRISSSLTRKPKGLRRLLVQNADGLPARSANRTGPASGSTHRAAHLTLRRGDPAPVCSSTCMLRPVTFSINLFRPGPPQESQHFFSVASIGSSLSNRPGSVLGLPLLQGFMPRGKPREQSCGSRVRSDLIVALTASSAWGAKRAAVPA